jgi:hypothetical protein
VKGKHDRDRAIERLLRESRRDGLSSQLCVEAETLAAWSEGTLAPAEARTVEAHISQCQHCQSMLAVFARSQPVPATFEPIWRRWHLRWLVPATAIAAALAIWVAVPADRPPSSPARTDVAVERGAAGRRSPSAGDGSVNLAAPREAPLPSFRDDGGQGGSATASPPQSGQSGRVAVDPRERESLRGTQRREADASVKSTERTSKSAAKAEPSTAATNSLRQQPDTQPPAAAPSSPLVPPVGAGAAAAIVGAQPTPAPLRLDRAVGNVARVPFEIESPDARHRWRIDPGGRLQHSSSAGSTWQAVSTTSTDVLTAGMSPIGSVCWLVGRTGAVWLTTDGLRFDRRPLPEPVDLISVRAADARHATVAAADGRTFVTADGGLTWGH